MALSNIWVVTEPSNGSFTTTSLELLTPGAHLRRARVSAITWGGDARTGGASPASTARRRSMTSATSVARLPGVPVASAIAGARRVGRRARRHPHPDELRRPRHRRSALGSTRSTGADERDRTERRRRTRHRAPDLRRSPDGEGALHRRGSRHLSSSAPSPSPPKRAAARRRRSSRRPSGDVGSDGHGEHHGDARRRASRSETRRGRGRRLGWTRARRSRQVRDDRRDREVAQRRRGRESRHRRRRVGFPTRTRSARPARP